VTDFQSTEVHSRLIIIIIIRRRRRRRRTITIIIMSRVRTINVAWIGEHIY
jgi:translation initiation factor 1 (eIF-1/SUI1)